MDAKVQAAIDRVASGQSHCAIVDFGGMGANFVQVYDHGEGLKIDLGSGISREKAEELGFSETEYYGVKSYTRSINNVPGASEAVVRMAEHITDGTVRWLRTLEEIDNTGHYTKETPYYF